MGGPDEPTARGVIVGIEFAQPPRAPLPEESAAFERENWLIDGFNASIESEDVVGGE